MQDQLKSKHHQPNLYSSSYQKLIESVKNKLPLGPFNPKQDLIPQFMHDYTETYHVSPVPLVISQQQASEFEEFIKPLCQLIIKCMKIYFRDDSLQFSNYLNEKTIIYDLIKQFGCATTAKLIRHDVILSGPDIKLLEINVGTNVGGWQHDWLSKGYEQLFQESGIYKPSYRNISINIFKYLAEEIKKIKPNTNQNLLFQLHPEVAHDYSFQSSIRNLYTEVTQSKTNNLFFFDSFSKIDFAPNGSVIFENQVMDAIMLGASEEIHIPDQIHSRLCSSALGNHFVYPDNPLNTILGNKTLLALIHEPEVLSSLSANEMSYIKRHIPWTSKINKPKVLWQEQQYEMLELLYAYKDQLVIKKSHSMGGKDVFVGKFTDTDSWQAIARDLYQDNDWLVQEYCTATHFTGSTKFGNIDVLEPVWGIFDIKNQYGGGFVRVSQRSDDVGVINSANGALEFTVFEEAAKVIEK